MEMKMTEILMFVLGTVAFLAFMGFAAIFIVSGMNFILAWVNLKELFYGEKWEQEWAQENKRSMCLGFIGFPIICLLILGVLWMTTG